MLQVFSSADFNSGKRTREVRLVWYVKNVTYSVYLCINHLNKECMHHARIYAVICVTIVVSFDQFMCSFSPRYCICSMTRP